MLYLGTYCIPSAVHLTWMKPSFHIPVRAILPVLITTGQRGIPFTQTVPQPLCKVGVTIALDTGRWGVTVEKMLEALAMPWRP